MLDLQVAAADHVEHDPGDVAICVRPPPIARYRSRANSIGSEEVLAHAGVVAEDELFAVEEDEVDAPRGVEVIEMVGDFHQQRDARGAVVGAEEGQRMAIGSTSWSAMGRVS